MKWFCDGLDWLFPPYCGGCNQPGSRWCLNCQASIIPIPHPICNVCGIPQRWNGVCSKCRSNPPAYSALRSWVVYEGSIRNVILQLKYKRNISLGTVLAGPLSKFVLSMRWPVDLVVPVPLGKTRQKERGYNQVEFIARPLASLAGWQFDAGVLKRVRETRTQVGLNLAERHQNLKNAFRAEPQLASGRKVLLIDDITTTGATLESCAEALRTAGTKTVYALTLARALPQHGLRVE